MSRLTTKPAKWHVRPAKIQISLGIRPVWSESLLCAQWVAKDPSFLHTDSKDSDQTGRMPRLIWVLAGPACHFVGLVMRQLIWFKDSSDHIHRFYKILLTLTFAMAGTTPPSVEIRIEPLQDKTNRITYVPSKDWSAWTPAQYIRAFTVWVEKRSVFNCPLSAQRRLWSDWADAQADLSLCWAHIILLVLSYLAQMHYDSMLVFKDNSRSVPRVLMCQVR